MGDRGVGIAHINHVPRSDTGKGTVTPVRKSRRPFRDVLGVHSEAKKHTLI